MRARRLRPTAAALAGTLAVALLAGACDTSPVAASVNGTEIKQTALNQEVRYQTSNTPFVQAVDKQAASSGGSTITGDAPGTYSATFVAGVLSALIGAEAVHQHLVATGQTVSPAALAAARSVEEAAFGTLWLSFPAAFRDSQVASAAEHAAIEPALSPADQAELRQVFTQVRKYFFADVCVRDIAVAVTGAGGLDQAASLAKAQQISQAYDQAAAGSAPTSSAGSQSLPGGGQVTCYDGAALEAQGADLYDRVLALAPGEASAPIAQPFGYEVLVIDSRLEQAYSPAVAEALALIVSQARGAQDPAYDRVLAAAHVSVDPEYGSWEAGRAEVVPSSPLGANSTASDSSSAGASS